MADNISDSHNNIARRPSSDLPFLVTHWLSHYSVENNAQNGNSIPTGHGTSATDEAQQDALNRIQRATNDLANAFADLGAFGVNLSVSINTNRRL